MQGEVERKEEKTVFQWKLKEISSQLHGVSHCCFSTQLIFGGRSWVLDLFPPGAYYEGPRWRFYLVLKLGVPEPGPPTEMGYSVGIRTAKGGTEVYGSGTGTFANYSDSAVIVLTERSELWRRRDELLPQNVLTIILTLKLGDGSSETGVSKIAEDIGKLWPNGDHTDVLLKIKNVEFKAHRAILAARTPVLGAMFVHNTVERASGEVSIDDCEPEVFEQFLHYIYKGAPRELTAENASSLYVLADKYLVSELKAQCVRCMRDTLCLDTFCDTLALSLMHGEEELLKSATDFLSKNTIDVMKTLEWQTFMQQHTTWANEITIRAMELTTARHEKALLRQFRL